MTTTKIDVAAPITPKLRPAFGDALVAATSCARSRKTASSCLPPKVSLSVPHPNMAVN